MQAVMAVIRGLGSPATDPCNESGWARACASPKKCGIATSTRITSSPRIRRSRSGSSGLRRVLQLFDQLLKRRVGANRVEVWVNTESLEVFPALTAAIPDRG